MWDSSLILVMEDDSQDGADHVDAHRMPALAISPYAKRGAVVHTRYDFPSLIRTAELPIGMKPFTLFDALATPLYDAFDPTPSNSQPFDAATPNIDLTATNPDTPANRAAVRGYNMTATDRVPQRVLDAQCGTPCTARTRNRRRRGRTPRRRGRGRLRALGGGQLGAAVGPGPRLLELGGEGEQRAPPRRGGR